MLRAPHVAAFRTTNNMTHTRSCYQQQGRRCSAFFFSAPTDVACTKAPVFGCLEKTGHILGRFARPMVLTCSLCASHLCRSRRHAARLVPRERGATRGRPPLAGRRRFGTFGVGERRRASRKEAAGATRPAAITGP